jgi:hypothetical protein
MVDCLLPLMRCGLQTEIETPTSILEMQMTYLSQLTNRQLLTGSLFSHFFPRTWNEAPTHKNNPGKYVFSRTVKSALLECLIHNQLNHKAVYKPKNKKGSRLMGHPEEYMTLYCVCCFPNIKASTCPCHCL